MYSAACPIVGCDWRTTEGEDYLVARALWSHQLNAHNLMPKLDDCRRHVEELVDPEMLKESVEPTVKQEELQL